MKICICGGGNLGHVVAGFVATRQGVEVSLLTRHPERWSRQLEIETPDGYLLNASLSRISSDPQDVVADADIVIICLPGYSIREMLIRIKNCLQPGTAVGSVVSSTGFFFDAMEVLPQSNPLFGFQRVPFIARVKEYGHSASLLGFKDSLQVAVERSQQAEALCETLQQMFNTPTHLMANHYEVSLSNSNPLLHPARLYDLWSDWKEGDVCNRIPYFYEEWTERAAELYIAMDNEFQQLLAVLPVRKGSIPTVLDYYESTDAASLAAKLRSIKAFKGIQAPMLRVGNGYVPDFQSRYFTEDFPYGLAVISRLAHEKKVASPVIDRLCQWGLDKASTR